MQCCDETVDHVERPPQARRWHNGTSGCVCRRIWATYSHVRWWLRPPAIPFQKRQEWKTLLCTPRTRDGCLNVRIHFWHHVSDWVWWLLRLDTCLLSSGLQATTLIELSARSQKDEDGGGGYSLLLFSELFCRRLSQKMAFLISGLITYHFWWSTEVVSTPFRC